MKVCVYYHPEEGSDRPVANVVTEAAAIRYARASWPARRGLDPRSDLDCLDEFLVVNWADHVEVIE